MPLCSMRVQDIIVAVAMHGAYSSPVRLVHATARPRGTPLSPKLPLRVVDLETRELRMLVAIADEGTVTRAATCLNVSQPALSHGLRVLERRVCISLFERQSRGLVPTEAGERLLRTARAVLREIER